MAALERIPDSITELTGVTSVYLGGTRVKDISILAQMTWLNTLDLSATLVEDLSPCAALVGLTRLELYGAPVSDIHMLAHLTEMQILVLSSTRVTDISALAGMTKLHRLWLKDTSVDVLQLVAEGSAFADEDRDLEDLTIWGTPATLDEGFLSTSFDGYEKEVGYASAVLAAMRAERDRRRS